MNILAMDTATPRTVVALLNDRQVLGEHGEASRNHSVTLLPAMDQLLKDRGIDRSGIDAVVVGIGPGSFTGLRVGLTMAKTMAFAMHIPLVGVSTLQALALNGSAARVHRVCAVLDALKQEVYCATYQAKDGKMTELQSASARDPRSFAEELGRQAVSCMLLGTGAQRYRNLFTEVLRDQAVIPGEESPHQIRAASVGLLGWARLQAGERDDPHRLEPNYCRLSEAELSRQKKMES